MQSVVGCELEEFRRYYKKLPEDKEWQRRFGEGTFGFSPEPSTSWERILTQNPSQFIVVRNDNEIIGHLVWHESNTEEHREGDARDEEDRHILRQLLGGKGEFVELHEIWLRQKHRGKGYGKKLFRFFEDFIRKEGYDSIIYYADHPTGVAICRKRGYKEAYLEKEKEYVFYLPLT